MRPRTAERTLPRLVAVVGPTASGKTDLALDLARRFGGEVISADSRQLYRGTEIGSDIPKGAWRRTKGRKGRKVYAVKGVPHHLMAILPPSKTLTAAEYKEKAVTAAKDIIGRGRLPILAGGTGLYVRAVVDNLSMPEVPPDPVLRRRLERKTTPQLFATLTRKDPAYAARIPANNRRYAIRALEVIAKTGKPFSALQAKGEPLFDVLQLAIRRPRGELYARIDARVDVLMKRGLLLEARRLGRRYGWSLPAMSGLGHRQLGLFLDGKMTLDEAVRLIKRDTRHYAKRQMTWFGKDKRVIWVRDAAQAARAVARFIGVKKGRNRPKTMHRK